MKKTKWGIKVTSAFCTIGLGGLWMWDSWLTHIKADMYSEEISQAIIEGCGDIKRCLILIGGLALACYMNKTKQEITINNITEVMEPEGIERAMKEGFERQLGSLIRQSSKATESPELKDV